MREQREVVKAFMAALHAGDFEGLIAVLDPDVIVRVDEAVGRPGAPRAVRGAEKWARARSRLLKRLEARSPLRRRLGARKRCWWIGARDW